MTDEKEVRKKSLQSLMDAMGQDQIRGIPGVTIRIQMDEGKGGEEVTEGAPEEIEPDPDDENLSPIQKIIKAKKKEMGKA